MVLQPGARYRVILEFRDYDSKLHSVGEEWVFRGYDVFPYDDGHTFWVDFSSGEAGVIRLQRHADSQAHILESLEKYVRPIKVEFERIGPECDSVLNNLYQHYIHDMSEWLGMDVQLDGRFAYETRFLWTDGFSVFLARSDDQLVGFAVVGSAQKWTGNRAAHDVKDFFVLRAYRHHGIAHAMARHIWNEFPGQWLVRVLTTNKPAVPFWRRAMRDSLGTRYEEQIVSDRGREWCYFRFDNSTQT